MYSISFIIWIGFIVFLLFSINHKQEKIEKKLLTEIEVVEPIEELEEVIEEKKEENGFFEIPQLYPTITEVEETEKVEEYKPDSLSEQKEIIQLNAKNKGNLPDDAKYFIDHTTGNKYFIIKNKEPFIPYFNKVPIDKKDKEELVYYILYKAEQKNLKEENKGLREISEKKLFELFNIIIAQEKLKGIDYIKLGDTITNQQQKKTKNRGMFDIQVANNETQIVSEKPKTLSWKEGEKMFEFIETYDIKNEVIDVDNTKKENSIIREEDNKKVFTSPEEKELNDLYLKAKNDYLRKQQKNAIIAEKENKLTKIEELRKKIEEDKKKKLENIFSKIKK